MDLARFPAPFSELGLEVPDYIYVCGAISHGVIRFNVIENASPGIGISSSYPLLLSTQGGAMSN